MSLFVLFHVFILYILLFFLQQSNKESFIKIRAFFIKIWQKINGGSNFQNRVLRSLLIKYLRGFLFFD